MYDAQIAEVDEFIAGYKTLNSFMPPWRRMYASDWSVRWGLLDELEVQRAELCLSVDYKREKPSIVAIFKRKLIYRVDLVPATECKPNPPDAWQYGLGPKICGSHTHPWSANRGHVKRNGFDQLPYRRPVAVTAITLDHALAVAAEDLNITILPSQRGVTLPSLDSLF